MRPAFDVRRVAVIGAGPAGLAAKNLLAVGLQPTVFERSDGIGGVWRYSPPAAGKEATTSQPPQSPAYRCLTTNSSREMTSFSDFPMDPTASLFPTCAEMETYLRGYAAHFRLSSFIRFQTTVTNVSRIDNSSTKADRWLVTFRDATKDAGEQEEFDAVLVCCGMFWHPNIPKFLGQETFKGKIIHSHAYRVTEPYTNKNVLLVGIGNSALDISLELALVAQSVTLSARSGSIVLFVEDDHGKAVDQQLLSRAAQRMSPDERRKHFFSFQITPTFVKNGMPPPPWRPEQAHHSLIKRKKEHLQQLQDGKIKIKPNINEINKDMITFVDGSVMEKCDAIIFCTGYSMAFPFIDDTALVPGIDEGRLDLYKKILHPVHPTLAFIAQVDTIGSIFAISEMQARWTSQVLANKLSLPSQAEMVAEIEEHKKRLAKVKPKFPMFVNYISYMDDLAQAIGCLPSAQIETGQVKHVLEHGPVYPMIYRLQGEGRWPQASATLARL